MLKIYIKVNYKINFYKKKKNNYNKTYFYNRKITNFKCKIQNKLCKKNSNKIKTILIYSKIKYNNQKNKSKN